MDIIRVADTETTGQAPDCAIIEIGWTDVSLDGEIIAPPRSMIVRPSRKIEVGAMAVHHITQLEADAGCDEASWHAAFGAPPPGCRIVAFAAHNADFEKSIITHVSPWVCTYRSALSLWDEAEKHSNQYLRYWLDLDIDSALAHPVHRAGPDSYVTAGIMTRLLREMTLEQMLHATNSPILLKKIGFGKHFGMRFEDLDAGYLGWLRNNITDNPDLTFTVQHEMARRAGLARSFATNRQQGGQPHGPQSPAPAAGHLAAASGSLGLPAVPDKVPATQPIPPIEPKQGNPFDQGLDFGSLFSTDVSPPGPT
ncbi:exonuclease domain-containing protein [Acidiphilium sp. C61]|uniref:exonuclease domain-containing protein n=1 Tax=Acidiphilium sp. C61 TaxID=1671485 RepID=UPI00157A6391|nr:exonuclease domain-containing protein [Acidiphilium sp. C61]